MAERVVIMGADEYDDFLRGLNELPFDVDRRKASNGKFIRTKITVSKKQLSDALKAREYTLVKPDDGSDINFKCVVEYED